MSARRDVHEFRVGDSVRLSGKFLRNTGQSTGPEGRAVFKVIAIDGDFLITDHLLTETGYWTAEELAADPLLRHRRIHSGNVTRIGTLSSRDCP